MFFGRKGLRFGVIGVGHMGQYHVGVLISLPYVKLEGIYDVNEGRAFEIAKRYNVKAFKTLSRLFESVDAVIIAVPTSKHYEVAIEALDRGKHVLIEKPMTDDIEKGRELVRLAKKKKLVFQVGHVERFNGAVLELYKIIKNPIMMESRRLGPYTGRINDVGVVLDLMIHDIDIILNIVKQEIKDVRSTGVSVHSKFEDIANVQMIFSDGCFASITSSRVSQIKLRTLAITQPDLYAFLDYSNQDIHIHRQASTAFLLTKDEIRYRQEFFVEHLYVHKENPLRLEHEHFINCIIGKEKPLVYLENDLKTLDITLDITRSIMRDMNVHPDAKEVII